MDRQHFDGDSDPIQEIGKIVKHFCFLNLYLTNDVRKSRIRIREKLYRSDRIRIHNTVFWVPYSWY